MIASYWPVCFFDVVDWLCVEQGELDDAGSRDRAEYIGAIDDCDDWSCGPQGEIDPMPSTSIRDGDDRVEPTAG